MLNNKEKIDIPPSIGTSPLADFLRANAATIIKEWTNYARVIAPAGDDMSRIALQDHIVDLLSYIIEDLEMGEAKAKAEREENFTEANPKGLDPKDDAAKIHAALRLADGFDMNELIAEYRALRGTVIRLWIESHPTPSKESFDEFIRFNETIDQVMTDSINHYVVKLDHSRNIFLSILAHDLRNPLGAASMSAQLMMIAGTLDHKQKILASQIVDSTLRASDIISDLLDLTRGGFGADLPVHKEAMNMELLARKLSDEMKSSHPGRVIILDIDGDMEGEWDEGRMGQVFSNLIGNALQYSYKETPVKITLHGTNDKINLSVHNEGSAIPASSIPTIFDALTRAVDGTQTAENPSNNLGLGLYITKKIVVSHGGKIKVESNKDGTIFNISLPRR